jgi:hypothetical protein
MDWPFEFVDHFATQGLLREGGEFLDRLWDPNVAERNTHSDALAF